VRLNCFLIMAIVLTGCMSPRGFPPVGGIQNFDKVDDYVCRGAQPTHLAILNLGGSRVGAVLNLRNDPLPYEESACKEAGLVYTNISLSGLRAPSKAAMEKVQAELDRLIEAHGAVFVHCAFGCERTGIVVACYRIRHNGYTPQQALDEAEGYGMRGMFVGAKEFILHWK